MGDIQTGPRRVLEYLKKRQVAIVENVKKGNLWKRMIRNTVATTFTIAITLIHYDSAPVFGKAAYLAAMVTVFSHPGRRVGQVIEALAFSLLGLIFGVCWAVLGLWLGSLVIEDNPTAGYAIRAIFLVIALMLHGFVRSQIPRAFLLALLFIIESLQGLTTTSKQVSSIFVASLVYPVLLAAAVILLVSITIFPEFSSSFLGTTTMTSLDVIADALQKAGSYFVATEREILENGLKIKGSFPLSEHQSDRETQSKVMQDAQHMHKGNATTQTVRSALSDITASKSGLRSQLKVNKNAQNETQFELAFSHLPPHSLGPISKKAMKRLVTHTIAIIGCCETRFALLGDESDIRKKKNKTRPRVLVHTRTGLDSDGVDLDSVKRKKEIEFGDVKLLRYLLGRIRQPYVSFQKKILESIGIVKACVAYAYDVPTPSMKANADTQLQLSQLNKHCNEFQAALQQFDSDITATLEGAAVLQELRGEELDIMPRDEIFLIASFLLSVRQAATQIADMLACARLLVQQRSEAGSWRRLFLPNIRWRKWLYSGGEADEASPPTESRIARHKERKQESGFSSETKLVPKIGQDPDPEGSAAAAAQVEGLAPAIDDKGPEPKIHKERSTQSSWLWLRNALADILEWFQHSEDLSYAFKLTIATFLVTFPAFVPSLNSFYYERRGSWAALQLIFVFDVAIGTSIYNAYLRAIGTTLGSLWGWAVYAAKGGNPYVCVAMLFVGLLPATYVQLGSQYQKAGMVTIVSMSVVALATELQTVPGTSTENFLNRWIAFLIGGVVALLVEVILLPVKARTKLVEALATTTRRIGEMESCIAYGIEDSAILEPGFPTHILKRFDKASSKAKSSLDDAETFFPSCSTEPRLKGSFSKIAKIYEEIIFVLRQIVDKMDNVVQLRLAYGSGPLEEFNAQIYPYRRNVAGSISLILYAVHEALITKFPLPQFIPSARLAHLRLVNRTREVVQEITSGGSGPEAEKQTIKRVLRRKYMSWNAASAAQIEVIEYLEELTDLVKLLVGANEFQSGLLARPTLQEYAKASGRPMKDTNMPEIALQTSEEDGLRDYGSMEAEEAVKDPSLPLSLQRIQSRKQEAGLRKRISNDEKSQREHLNYSQA